MRYLLTTLSIVAAVACSAQGKTIHPEPRWIYGDIRTVTSTTQLKVTQGDSVTQQKTSTSTCRIGVPDMRKDYYVVTVHTDASDGLVGDMSAQVLELPEVFRDSVLKRMRHVVTDLYGSIAKGETRFKVDRTGKVVGFMDEEKGKEDLRPGLVEAVKELQSLSREDKRRTAQQLEASRGQMVDSLYDVFARMQLASLDLVLEPFANAYPESGSTRQPTTMKDVELPSLGAIGDLPAVMELGLDALSEKALVARIVITADADAVLKVFLARDPKSKLKKQDVSLVKECVFTMDRNTGWLTQATTEWRVRAGNLRARTNTITEYAVVKP